MTGLVEPLRFERLFHEKVWGGRALERRPGIALPPEMRVGESWEIVDRPDHDSVVAVGAHRGRTLHELVERHPKDLLGRARPTAKGRFPLLVKYIDASTPLSVQVHPDQHAARRLGEEVEGKTEAWFVLDAAPGASLYAGLAPHVDADALARAAAGPGLVELLSRWDVQPGEAMLVPGGTVHAIGAGVTLLEVQENSDTTFRIYDWGRDGLDGRPRPVHLSEALDSTAIGQPRRGPIRPRWFPAGPGVERAPLTRSRSFGMNAVRVSERARFGTARQYQVYVVVTGRGRLVPRDGDPVDLEPGETWLLPSALGYHHLEPEGGLLELVQVLAIP